MPALTAAARRRLLDGKFVKAAVAVADGAGVDTSLLTVALTRVDGGPVAEAKQVLLASNTVPYAPGPGASNVSLTLGTVTKGSIIATPTPGSAWLIQTDANGEFACTATNTENEGPLYFFAMSPRSVSAADKSVIVLESNSDAATWS